MLLKCPCLLRILSKIFQHQRVISIRQCCLKIKWHLIFIISLNMSRRLPFSRRLHRIFNHGDERLWNRQTFSLNTSKIITAHAFIWQRTLVKAVNFRNLTFKDIISHNFPPVNPSDIPKQLNYCNNYSRLTWNGSFLWKCDTLRRNLCAGRDL